VNVLHLIESGGYFGAEVVIRQLALEQHRRGYAVTVAALRPPQLAEPELLRRCAADGVSTREVRLRHRLDIAAVREFSAAAANSGLQIIHTHGYKATIFSALLPAHLRIVKVATLHGWTGINPTRRVWWYETIERALLGRMDVVACVHESMRSVVASRRRTGARVRVVPNGIPCEKIETDTRERPGERTNPVPVVGFVGRLALGKGVDVLIAAASQLRERGHRVKLVIVGDGPMRAALEDCAREYGIEDDVEFTGYLSHATERMRQFDVLALPSRSEGMPMVVLEALAIGIPVVASDVGGCREALDGGRLGVLIAPESISECADGIRASIVDDSLRAEVRRFGPEWVRNHFGSPRMAALYETAYEDALARRNARPRGPCAGTR